MEMIGGTRLPVLIYHRVGPDDPDPRSRWLTVPTEKFERQVERLARQGFTGIGAADWLAFCREGKPLPKRPVLFTFDDGYADAAEHAYPILERHGWNAITFIVTGQLGGTNAWDATNAFPIRRLMTADQIRHWASKGLEFGGHSRRHVDLTNLAPAALEDEVSGCARDLAEITGRPSLSFAYPFGAHNEAVRAATRQAFPLAFGIEEGINGTAADPLDLRRTYVFPDDLMIDLDSRVRLGFSVVRRVQGAIRLRTRLAGLRARLRRA
jgi:peptidoglycan/xylan/chitin deacetylase (PgdA/CDA1 family)